MLASSNCIIDLYVRAMGHSGLTHPYIHIGRPVFYELGLLSHHCGRVRSCRLDHEQFWVSSEDNHAQLSYYGFERHNRESRMVRQQLIDWVESFGSGTHPSFFDIMFDGLATAESEPADSFVGFSMRELCLRSWLLRKLP